MTKTLWTMTIATILLSGLIALSFTNSVLATPELVTNGSFEDPNIPSNSWTLFPSIPGWTLSFGPSIELRDNVAGTASDGDQFVELDSTANSGISQTLSTTAGKTYLLSFDYSPRINQPASTNTVEAYWDGALVASLTGPGSGSNTWSTNTYNVVASGSSTVLEFRAAGTSDSLGGNIDSVSVTLLNEAPDCDNASPSQALLWPPNHNLVPITIDVADSDGDSVTVTIDGIQQDEELDAKGNGDGNTSPDGVIDNDTANVRAERNGTGDGRVYEISFTADDGNGGSCTGSVIVGVPHDKKDTPIDSLVRIDSTG